MMRRPCCAVPAQSMARSLGAPASTSHAACLLHLARFPRTALTRPSRKRIIHTLDWGRYPAANIIEEWSVHVVRVNSLPRAASQHIQHPAASMGRCGLLYTTTVVGFPGAQKTKSNVVRESADIDACTIHFQANYIHVLLPPHV